MAEGGEGGGSSTLPHKRNPAGSARAIACAHRARGEASILLGAMAQEHERAAGAWQAEWQAVSGALAATGGAAAAVRGCCASWRSAPTRMRANLELTGGLVMTEAVVTALAGAGWSARRPTTWWRELAGAATAAARPPAGGPRVADLSEADWTPRWTRPTTWAPPRR